MTTKIATWNVNSLRVRLPHVLEWLAAEQPDVLALQETKLVDDDFPVEEIAAAGYRVVYSGQKTYNGVALLSRVEAKDVIREFPDFDDPQRRVLAATIGPLRVLDVYIPNGESVDSDKYRYKLGWLERLREFVRAELAAHPHFVVLGDFNIAPDARDVYDPAAWEGKVLFSEPERAAFRGLLELGLHDSFRLFEQPEKSFSWWDYRMNMFKRKLGLRIDHILVSDALRAVCRGCRIDVEPRRKERPSDHTPVVAEFDVAAE